MTIRLVQYHTWQKVRGGNTSSVRCALVKRGRKWLQVIAMDASPDGGVKVWKVPMSDERFMKPLMHKGKPYPMKRALRIFRSMARTHGITKGAKKLLKEASREQKTRKDTAGEVAATTT